MSPDEAREFYGATPDDLIARWDSGRTIWSVEMGGMGPGYEQAIQVAAVEIVRRLKDDWIPPEGGETIELECLAVSRQHDLRLSGAQAGAAMHLACNWLAYGPAGLVERAKDGGAGDRLIQVSRSFPTIARLEGTP